MIKIADIVKEGDFYLAGLEGVREAYETAIGPQVLAWYRRSFDRLGDKEGYREENWFLTLTDIVVGVATGNGLEFVRYARSQIVEVKQRYEIVERYMRPYLVLRKVTVVFVDGRDVEIPVPDRDHVHTYGSAYREFVNQLI